MKDYTKDSKVDPNPMEELSPEDGKDSIYHNELEDNQDEKAEIYSGKTTVARSVNQNMLMMAIGIIIVGLIIYMSFFRDSNKNKLDSHGFGEKPSSAADELLLPGIPNTQPPPPDFSLPNNTKKIPPPLLPPEIKLTTPQPQQPAMELPLPIPTKNSVESQQRTQSKLSSSIMLTTNSKGADNSADSKKTSQMYLETFLPVHTNSAQQRITYVGNMSLLVSQGKIIETILETPINTNYPGPIRAIVSTDVYSENGNNVLIARGSRVVGAFTGGFTPGQTRVLIAWNRIIMPNGYDIAVESPAVGPIGTMGVDGLVDNQIVPTMTNAVLFSAINVAFAELAGKATGSKNASPSQASNTTHVDGTVTSTTTASPTQQAIQQQTTAIGSTAQELATQSFSTKPFITIDQGTMVNIFVNRDILFPSDLTTSNLTIR